MSVKRDKTEKVELCQIAGSRRSTGEKCGRRKSKEQQVPAGDRAGCLVDRALGVSALGNSRVWVGETSGTAPYGRSP